MKNEITFMQGIKFASAFAVVGVLVASVFFLKDIFFMLLAALIFAIALDRPIENLVKRNIPRSLSVLAIYSVVLILLTVLFYLIFPQIIKEVRNFASSYPMQTENLPIRNETSLSDIPSYLRFFAQDIASSTDAIIGTMSKIVGGFISFLAIFFISLFLNIREGGLRALIPIFVPKKLIADAEDFFDKVREKVGLWIWGKTLSSLIVGLIVFIGLVVIGIPYVLILSALAILLNYIPFVGPVVASLPAIALGLVQSPLHALAVIALYFLANAVLESFLFGPLLMKKAIKMNPAMLIIFAIVGERLGGIVGLIIAIPVSAIIYLVTEEYMLRKKISRN